MTPFQQKKPTLQLQGEKLSLAEFWSYLSIKTVLIKKGVHLNPVKYIFIKFNIKSITISNSKVVLGDSLTAGYQLNERDAFPNQLEQLIGIKTLKFITVAYLETQHTLLNRLVFSLKPTPDIAFIAIGANDGLRGMPAMNTKQNISQMITILKHKQIRVILGMTIPQNYTKSYIQSFENVFPDLAKEYQIPIMPFY